MSSSPRTRSTESQPKGTVRWSPASARPSERPTQTQLLSKKCSCSELNTTLLTLINLLEEPTSGSVKAAGVRYEADPTNRTRRKAVARFVTVQA